MYICLCQAVTDSDIREAADAGATDLDHLAETLGLGSGCGSCLETAAAIIDARRAESLSHAA